MKKTSSFLVILFLFWSSLNASSGILSLNISDNSYIINSGRPDKIVGLFLAKVSETAYHNTLSTQDKDFFSDNGFSNLKLNTTLNGIEFLTATKNLNIKGKTKKLILIAFRGTQEVQDVLIDALYDKTPFFDNKNILVHSGFHTYFKRFRDNEGSIKIDANTLLSMYIAKKSDDTLFLLTGHSLGGAIAKLYAASLFERGIAPENIFVYTYGAPPVGYSTGKETFSDRYRIKRIGTPYSSGFFLSKYENFNDPVANLVNLYFKDGSKLVPIVATTTYFNENGDKVYAYGGCKYIGSQSLVDISLADIVSKKYIKMIENMIDNEIAYNKVNDDLPNCDYTGSPHKIGKYIENLYKDIDFYAIAKNKIANYDKKITLSKEDAKEIASIVQLSPYKEVIRNNKFDASKLSEQDRKNLISSIKELGIGIGADSFGEEGKDIRSAIKNMVDAKKIKINNLAQEVQSSQYFDTEDYMKIAWGTALNIAEGVATLVTLGEASLEIKGTKFANKFGKVTKIIEKNAKFTKFPRLKKVVEIAEKPEFIFVKELIANGFTVTDSVKNNIENDEATAQLVTNWIGAIGNATAATIKKKLEGKKTVIFIWFAKKLNNIVTNLIKGEAEALITDENTQIAFDELLDSIEDMIPIWGNWREEKKLVEKVANEIDSREEVVEAWHKYNDMTNSLIDDIKIFGDSWFAVRLNAIINSALAQNNIYDEKREQLIKEIQNNKPSIYFIIPSSVTIDSSTIKATKDDEIKLVFTYKGGGLTDWIANAVENNQTVLLWYDDYEDPNNIKRKSINLSLTSLGYTDGFYELSFKAPLSNFVPIKFTYYDSKHGRNVSYELNDNIKYIADYINDDNSISINPLNKPIIVEIDGGLIEDKYQAKYMLRLKKNGELKLIQLNLEKDRECKDKENENKSSNQNSSCSPSAVDIFNGDWSINNDNLLLDLYDLGEFEVKLNSGKLEKNMQLLKSNIINFYKAYKVSLEEFEGKTLTFFSETGKYSYWTFGLNGVLYIKNDENKFTTANWSLKGTDDQYIDITNNGKTVLRIYGDQFMVGDLVDMYGFRGILIDIADNSDNNATRVSNIYLTNETHKDYTIAKDSFTKTWTFSEDISGFDIEVISNSYTNSVTSSNFGIDYTKGGKILRIYLTPDTSKTINKLVLKFTHNGNPVKVNGSDTFWSITRTNHPPRLADGQITQLVSATNKPAFLDIATYDGDGDKVSLSIEDSAGGYVGFSKDDPNKIFASFDDGNTTHTIKIGLSDGKEKVIVPLHVLQFNKSSIEDFYSDVDKDAGDYPFDGIAFGTLEGVVWGQPDPNDPNKRIFRPKDDASMAEALAMIINAEKKAGLIQLASANEYMDVYPSWAMPYYTYARECGALDEHILNLADMYPTRENIAKIIVKTLGLDQQKLPFDVNATFSDSQDFSDDSMLYYAKIAKTFGLFMTGDSAKPKEHINRARLAQVIKNIFMIPQAKLSVTPSDGEYEDNFSYQLTVSKAEDINDSLKLYDNKNNLKVSVFSNGKKFDTNSINNTNLKMGPNTIYALLDNNGVKNITRTVYTVNFSDQDGDGVQDKDDKWIDDPRYSSDKNNNGIPDILDKIYGLSSYKVDDSIIIGGISYSIADLIKNGGIYTIDQKNISKIRKGWNLLSGDINIDILDNPNVQVAWSYKDGKWSAYSWNNQIMQEINDKGIQTLNELNETQGVWIKASKDLELNLKDTNITGYFLKAGWNLLGTNKELNATYFNNSCAKYIWKYDNTLENSWRVYVFDDNISSSYPYSFDSIRKGEGFWLRCKRDNPSLLASYKFDKSEYSDTKINDMSEYDHTLSVSSSYYNNDPYIKPHIIDDVYQWDDTYLELNNSKIYSSSFKDINISNAITILASLKTDNKDGNFPIISFADKGTSDLSFGASILGINLYYPSHSGWKFSLQVRKSDGDTYQIFPSNENPIEIGKFYHIAYVIYKNGDIKVYYNGVEGLGGHIDNLAIFKEGINNKMLLIGGGMGNGFVGGIDDVMIFNRALKPDEIKLYAKTIKYH